MKKISIIVVSILLFITLAYLYIQSQSKNTQETEVTQVADRDKVTAKQPLTLEYLQSQPEWNPTMELEGIERLSQTEFQENGTNTLRANIGNFIVSYNSVDKIPVIKTSDGVRDYWQIDVDKKDYQIFAVFSLENEFLHAYKLKGDVSYLISDTLTGPGEFILFETYKEWLSVAVNYYGEIKYYRINPYSGEVFFHDSYQQ